ncbi:MAG: Hsp20/alpha crystallin family protein [Erysipelotrichaceae bacterium]|nr:Hsp20/alpha crystallin family protein [Erysipelotrichaceae bacterium]MBR2701337.1 Hsp20/alpha crystallin family protein [Erysipelotrichaceae bacterium]
MLNYFLKPVRRYNTDRTLWDEFFNNDFYPQTLGQMKTDIKETEKEYLLDIEMPGYNKNNVEITVNDGYLTVTGTKEEKKESGEKEYITRERYTGKVSRSWYIGDVNIEDVKASFTDGILKISVPKEDRKKEISYINID